MLKLTSWIRLVCALHAKSVKHSEAIGLLMITINERCPGLARAVLFSVNTAETLMSIYLS